AAVQLNTVEIGLDVGYRPVSPDATARPWVDAVFQGVAPNKVRLTITAPHLTDPEFAQYVYFNFNETNSASKLVFSPVFSDWQGVLPIFTSTTSKNGLRADGGGVFDIRLGFLNGRRSQEFNGGDKVVFDITLAGGSSLSALDFAFNSSPGA